MPNISFKLSLSLFLATERDEYERLSHFSFLSLILRLKDYILKSIERWQNKDYKKKTE